MLNRRDNIGVALLLCPIERRPSLKHDVEVGPGSDEELRHLHVSVVCRRKQWCAPLSVVSGGTDRPTRQTDQHDR